MTYDGLSDRLLTVREVAQLLRVTHKRSTE